MHHLRRGALTALAALLILAWVTQAADSGQQEAGAQDRGSHLKHHLVPKHIVSTVPVLGTTTVTKSCRIIRPNENVLCVRRRSLRKIEEIVAGDSPLWGSQNDGENVQDNAGWKSFRQLVTFWNVTPSTATVTVTSTTSYNDAMFTSFYCGPANRLVTLCIHS